MREERTRSNDGWQGYALKVAGAIISILLGVTGFVVMRMVDGAPVSGGVSASDFDGVRSDLRAETTERQWEDKVLKSAVAGISSKVDSIQDRLIATQDDMRSANANSLAARQAAEANTVLLKEVRRKLQ